MKANLKGRGGIKGLFLLHGEKIAIVLIGLLALWFVYSSWNLPSLEDKYQASNLQQEVKQTNLSVTESRWPEPDSELAAEVRPFKPIAKYANLTVKSEDYSITGLDLPVIAPTLLRDDPLVLNAVYVRAIGGWGLLSFRDERTRKEQERRLKLAEEERQKKEKEQQNVLEQPQGREGGKRGSRGRGDPEGPEFSTGEFDPEHPDRRLIEGMTTPAGVPLQGGERIERAHWATVVAKVPIREQIKRFQDAFENAKGGFDPARDFPRYVGYVVERSEIVGGKALPWQRVFLFDCQRKSIASNRYIEKGVNEKAVSKLYEIAGLEWAGMPVEPVDERYKDPVLTLPLPPLVGRDFGADATHPDIPLAINAPPLEQEIEPLPEQPTEKPAEEDGELQFGTADSTQIVPGAGMQGRMPSRSPYPGGEFGMGRPSYGSRGGREFGGEGPQARVGGFSGGMSTGQKTTLPPGVDFWLLRFIDYTVQPGKKYKYRVKVVLADPNYGFERSYLAPAVLDRKVGLARWADDWSEPSPTVGIPLEGTVYVAEAKLPAAKLHNDEPTVKLWAETFDIDTEGTAIHVAKDKDFHRGAVVNLEDKMLYTGEGDRWRDTFDSYTLQTGITLLDVDGAEPLVKDMTAPARVLLMDAAGELSIRNEMDDSMTVEQLRFLFTEDKRRGRPEEGAMPFGPAGGFRGPQNRGRPR